MGTHMLYQDNGPAAGTHASDMSGLKFTCLSVRMFPKHRLRVCLRYVSVNPEKGFRADAHISPVQSKKYVLPVFIGGILDGTNHFTNQPTHPATQLSTNQSTPTDLYPPAHRPMFV